MDLNRQHFVPRGLLDGYITYLSGCVVPGATLGQRPDLGVLLTPHAGNRPEQLGAWGLDNGLFHPWSTPARPFNEKKFFGILDREVPRHGDSCLFAVVPDVVYDAVGTIGRFDSWAPRIREYGVPLAFAAQDGHELLLDSIPWDDFDVLFLGGSTCGCRRCTGGRADRAIPHDATGGWKLDPARAGVVVTSALEHGKRVHFARVNSEKRLRLAQAWGASSADGTYLGIAGRDNGLPKVHGWLDDLNTSLDWAFIDNLEAVA